MGQSAHIQSLENIFVNLPLFQTLETFKPQCTAFQYRYLCHIVVSEIGRYTFGHTTLPIPWEALRNSGMQRMRAEERQDLVQG